MTRDEARQLVRQLRSFAEAQRVMAADTKEDRTHWHHVSLAEVLERAAKTIEARRNEGCTVAVAIDGEECVFCGRERMQSSDVLAALRTLADFLERESTGDEFRRMVRIGRAAIAKASE